MTTFVNIVQRITGHDRLVVGCMTGTSLDAIDVSVVRLTGNGLALRARAEAFASKSLGELSQHLRELADQRPLPAGRIARLARALSLAHAEAITGVLRDARADLIAVHGQTIFHRPPLTWQLINPHDIARALRTPVVFDLRGADVSSGGQGAPITPLADAVLFRHADERRLIVNLGGFVNVTRLEPMPDALDPEGIAGGDVCPCNHVLDAIARAAHGTPFDPGGELAMTGTTVPEIVDALDAAFAPGPPRSLGTGDQLTQILPDLGARHAGPDLARSACAWIARSIAARAVGVDRVLAAGGGTHNSALMHELTRVCPCPVGTTAELGVEPQQRESVAMAVLGGLSADRVPITLPAVTAAGRPRPVAGSWVFP